MVSNLFFIACERDLMRCGRSKVHEQSCERRVSERRDLDLRLIELGAIFQDWNCAVLNGCAIFLR